MTRRGFVQARGAAWRWGCALDVSLGKAVVQLWVDVQRDLDGRLGVLHVPGVLSVCLGVIGGSIVLPWMLPSAET